MISLFFHTMLYLFLFGFDWSYFHCIMCPFKFLSPIYFKLHYHNGC